MALKKLGFVVLPMLVVAAVVHAADDFTAFDIPKLPDVKIDGKGDDWGDKGFSVNALCDVAGKTRAPEEFQCLL